MNLQVAAHTDVGRNRPNNEDSYLAEPPLLAVADGMGGPAAGEVASALAVEVLRRWKDGGEASAEGLEAAVLDAHRTILERAGADERLEGMGTTVTAIWVDGSRATVAHVGDSRAYLLRGGRLQQLTEDDTLVQQWVQEGKITPEEAAAGHPYRNYVLQAVGAQPDIEVEVLGLDLRPGDRLLISSDGLHGQSGMTDDRIRDLVASRDDVEAASRALVDSANEAGGDDNITVVLLELTAENTAPTDVQEPEDAGDAGTDVAAPVIVSRPSTGQHRTPAVRRSRRTTRWVGAGAAVVVLLLAGVFLLGGSNNRIMVASSDGRVVILEGRPGTEDTPATGRVVEPTDVPVSSLPETFRRRVEAGIVVGSMSEARSTVRSLPRILGPTEALVPTPDLEPPPVTGPP